MKLAAAKNWLGHRYVLSPHYRPEDHPWHSNYARVDLRLTFERIRRESPPSSTGGQVIALRRIFAEYKEGIGR